MKHWIGLIPGIAILSLLPPMPDGIRLGILLAAILVTVDTITGTVAAVAAMSLRSSTARSKLVVKLCQLWVIFTFGYVAAVATNSWWICQLSLLAIYSIEATSMMENVVKFQKYSGVNMGPANGFLQMVSVYFHVDSISRDTGHTIFTNATVVPDNKNEPLITTTAVDRYDKTDHEPQKPLPKP